MTIIRLLIIASLSLSFILRLCVAQPKIVDNTPKPTMTATSIPKPTVTATTTKLEYRGLSVYTDYPSSRSVYTLGKCDDAYNNYTSFGQPKTYNLDSDAKRKIQAVYKRLRNCLLSEINDDTNYDFTLDNLKGYLHDLDEYMLGFGFTIPETD